MTVRLYMDHNVRGAVTTGLRIRSVDVLTAQEDGWHAAADPDLLDRAGELERVLFTHDEDLLVEAAARQRAGRSFHGVIYVHQERLGIGETVDQLELIASASRIDELVDRVLFLPL